MPPPELPEMMELEIVRVPPLLLKAPPIEKIIMAPETVTPEIARFPLWEIVKILKLRLALPLSPLIVRLEEPGPVIVRVPAVVVLSIAGNEELSVMVPVTPVKMILSSDDAALASMIACLREPAPESLRFITGKVAGVILSSRVMSSSLEEMRDFLAFLLCEILKNLRKI